MEAYEIDYKGTKRRYGKNSCFTNFCKVINNTPAIVVKFLDKIRTGVVERNI